MTTSGEHQVNMGYGGIDERVRLAIETKERSQAAEAVALAALKNDVRADVSKDIDAVKEEVKKENAVLHSKMDQILKHMQAQDGLPGDTTAPAQVDVPQTAVHAGASGAASPANGVAQAAAQPQANAQAGVLMPTQPSPPQGRAPLPTPVAAVPAAQPVAAPVAAPVVAAPVVAAAPVAAAPVAAAPVAAAPVVAAPVVAAPVAAVAAQPAVAQPVVMGYPSPHAPIAGGVPMGAAGTGGMKFNIDFSQANTYNRLKAVSSKGGLGDILAVCDGASLNHRKRGTREEVKMGMDESVDHIASIEEQLDANEEYQKNYQTEVTHMDEMNIRTARRFDYFNAQNTSN